MVDPVKVGLIGAGPWARTVTGPVLASCSETALTGVWSRTPDNARETAAALGTEAFTDVDALIEASDAVAIALVPDAQPDVAIAAARAGKPMLLEKPLAADLDRARAVVDAIETAGVPTLLMLTNRFNPTFDAFAATAQGFDAFGGRGCFLSGAFLPGSPYARGWRLERGALLDVGPHLLDLLEVGLGEILTVHAEGDVHGWVSLTITHASGATSQASLCCNVAIESRTEIEVFGTAGSFSYDGRVDDPREVGRRIGETFAAVARGAAHEADAARGLHLQQIIDAAERQLAAR